MMVKLTWETRVIKLITKQISQDKLNRPKFNRMYYPKLETNWERFRDHYRWSILDVGYALYVTLLLAKVRYMLSPVRLSVVCL